ncbi:adhesion G-protein coupled receptor D1-like [Amphiura filiformis]|uniref:adhesion G-protein coupled receptor D1-like n=1 Tax=Amphiura filiformis TaxID=82378 RepID=UPI003B21FDBD
MWMFMEGINLFLKINPNINLKMKLPICMPIAWGLPAVIAVLTVAVGITEYAETGAKCWLPIKGGIIYAFVVPALAITLINMVFLVITIHKFLTLKTNRDKSEAARLKASIRAIAILSPLLGGTWIFGVLQFDQTSSIVFSYLFTICNGLQGVFVFFAQCLLDEDVRSFLRLKLNRGKVDHSSATLPTQDTSDGSQGRVGDN